MTVLREGFVLGETPEGPHRVAYLDWGHAGAARAVVCVHGLTGCARNFDLAAALAENGYRVVCPDIVGRGGSDRLADPGHYALGQYVADMTTLMTKLGLSEVAWVGTSLGGLIGMAQAAQPETPLRRLVLNDMGPFKPTAALQRLDTYVGSDPRFADLAEAEAYLRGVREPFGHLTNAQWRRMAEVTTRPNGGEDGTTGLRLDRTSGENGRRCLYLWDSVHCSVLVLRGQNSDLLLPETALEMTTRGPRARVVEVAGRGHNPPLLEAPEIDLVVGWLGAHD